MESILIDNLKNCRSFRIGRISPIQLKRSVAYVRATFWDRKFASGCKVISNPDRNRIFVQSYYNKRLLKIHLYG
jgi:hypothetical protein